GGEAGRGGWGALSRGGRAGALFVDGGLAVCRAPRREAHRLGRPVAPDHTRGGTGTASPRPRVCVGGAPLDTSRSPAAAGGKGARRRRGGWQRALAPCPRGGVSPATPAAKRGAARLAGGPGPPEPTTAAGPGPFGPWGPGASSLPPGGVFCPPAGGGAGNAHAPAARLRTARPERSAAEPLGRPPTGAANGPARPRARADRHSLGCPGLATEG